MHHPQQLGFYVGWVLVLKTLMAWFHPEEGQGVWIMRKTDLDKSG